MTRIHSERVKTMGLKTTVMTGMALVALSAAGFAQSPPPGAGTPQATSAKAEKNQPQESKSEPKPEDLERFRAAVRKIDASTEPDDLVAAAQVLRDSFPACRKVLHEGVQKGSVKVKAFALRILTEQGEAKEDLAIVKGVLADPDVRVRLAAIMAVRALGKEGLPALLDHLQGETNPNNRKMAIKTLQHWGDKGAIPPLARLLKREQDKGVRDFAVKALQRLSGKSIEDDADAWLEYAEALQIQEQAKKLMSAEKPAGEVTR